MSKSTAMGEITAELRNIRRKKGVYLYNKWDDYNRSQYLKMKRRVIKGL